MRVIALLVAGGIAVWLAESGSAQPIFRSGVELVTIEADDGDMKHFMPLLIGSM